MKIEIKTNKGNEFDIKDSIYSSSIGEYESIALSFYNIDIQFGISYYPDKNMIVFQNDDSVDIEYWNDEKIAEIENELSKHLPPNYNSGDELGIDFDYIVNYILDEMDRYYDYVNDKYSDFMEFLNNFLKE